VSSVRVLLCLVNKIRNVRKAFVGTYWPPTNPANTCNRRGDVSQALARWARGAQRKAHAPDRPRQGGVRDSDCMATHGSPDRGNWDNDRLTVSLGRRSPRSPTPSAKHLFRVPSIRATRTRVATLAGIEIPAGHNVRENRAYANLVIRCSRGSTYLSPDPLAQNRVSDKGRHQQTPLTNRGCCLPG
jgi:hypothetical protein